MSFISKVLGAFKSKSTSETENDINQHENEETGLEENGTILDSENILDVSEEKTKFEEANIELDESIKECGRLYVDFFNDIFGYCSTLKECWLIEDGSMEFIIEFDTPEQTEYIVKQEDFFNRNLNSSHKISALENNCVSLVISENKEDVSEQGIKKEIEQKIETLEKEENVQDILDGTCNMDKPENEEKYSEEEEQKDFGYVFPVIDLLKKGENPKNVREEIEQRAERLRQTFQAFWVNADIVSISYGPRFTRFEIQISKGVRIRDVLRIKDDIKLCLEATNLNIEAPISGRTTIGIDVENKNFLAVSLREMIESSEFREFPSNLALVIGKDMTGNIIVESLENMCHLLIGGTVGSGKSVCINSIIMSILYKADPDKVKLILIDTKMVNFSAYNGIPHLLIPVVTDLRKASVALQWGIAEMEDRYRKFSHFGVRDLLSYNKLAEKYDESFNKFPNIVIIIDDFSDLMIGNKNQVEESICRLAQMGRACGIHLIISVQRPSVDVITGMIKANMPSRIAFNVFSAIDSRTILDTKGAEELLGSGDMLFYPIGQRVPLRVQGTFVSNSEVSAVVDFLKNQMAARSDEAERKNALSPIIREESTIDYYFTDAGRLVIEKQKASIAMLQKVYKIGFNRAARLMDELVAAGVVGSEEGTKPRKILMTQEEFEEYLKER